MTVTIGARVSSNAASSCSNRTSLVASSTGSSPEAASPVLLGTRTSATSKPSSPATSDAVSRSINWLMVAKIPLLISSRITSAALTSSSSASSLTVMVGGSSIAPRSRGSRTCTPPGPVAPSRRGGLRGPRRPRVPLLLLATIVSFVIHRWLRQRCAGCDQQSCPVPGGDRDRQRPGKGALVQCELTAGAVDADVRAAPGHPATRILEDLSLIHISEPTRRTPISYAVFCL